jgi:TrmH family RNA methyltransferase
VETPPEAFFAGKRSRKVDHQARTTNDPLTPSDSPLVRRRGTAAESTISKKKHPIISEFRELVSLKGKLASSKFVVEGLTLIQRAVNDGLPVETILYTWDLLAGSEGVNFLNHAREEGLSYYQLSGGLMGILTTSRPLPPVIASVWTDYRDARRFHLTAESVLLIADSVSSPDNLGMVLRTADAAGVEGVVIIGDGASPFHKNCIRAARGAVGRIPLLYCENPEDYVRELVAAGFTVIGATARASRELYHFELKPPVAFVVGSEGEGIREKVLSLCTNRVRIPMAPGQSSLNVGVAAGILLYEWVRSVYVQE